MEEDWNLPHDAKTNENKNNKNNEKYYNYDLRSGSHSRVGKI
jgi:hypothetical protein